MCCIDKIYEFVAKSQYSTRRWTMSSHSAPSTCFSIHSEARSCASITQSRTPHSSATRFGAPRLSMWTICLTETSQCALSCGWGLRARGLLLHHARHRSSGDEARDVGGAKGHRSCAPLELQFARSDSATYGCLARVAAAGTHP
jgi:hypothetical protein